MRIGIDIQTTLGQKVGFGYYVENLIKNLKKYDQKNEYFFFRPKREKDLSTPERFIWDQITLPYKAKKAKVEVLHQPCFSVPIFYNQKIVVTVHDLISIFFPKNIPFVSCLFFSKWMPFSYKKADKIIAISKQTKKDIQDILSLPSEKIEVIYEAVGEEYKKINDQKTLEKIRKKYNLNFDFILHVGTIEPRKNLEFLVKAYAKTLSKFNLKPKLVIVGKRGWYYSGLFKLIKKLNLEKNIIFTGYVEAEDLPILYNLASLFVFPSLYEGFGLPPLEALACGCPVICSNTSSLPEVVGEAGILLAPNDQEAWAFHINKILNNEKLKKGLVEKGFKRSSKFSWKECALKTISVYEKVLIE